MKQKECFAYRNVGNHAECAALLSIDCEDCKFYKSIEQAEAEREKYGGLEPVIVGQKLVVRRSKEVG